MKKIDTQKIVSNRDVDKLVEEAQNKASSRAFVILDRGQGVKQIIPVTHRYSYDNWVTVITENNQELFVHKTMLFDTKENAQQFIVREY